MTYWHLLHGQHLRVDVVELWQRACERCVGVLEMTGDGIPSCSMADSWRGSFGLPNSGSETL